MPHNVGCPSSSLWTINNFSCLYAKGRCPAVHLSDHDFSPSLYLPVKLYACVYACQHIYRASFHVPLSFVCACVSSFSAALWNQLCVCLLYLVHLLQESRLPAAALSLHIYSVRPVSLPEGRHVYFKYADAGCTAGSLLVEVRVHGFVCIVCTRGAICSISLYLTSCACWLYLCPSPGLPAPGEWTASRRTVTQHQLCQTQKGLRTWDKQSLPLCQMGFCFTTTLQQWIGFCLFLPYLDCGLERT